MSSFTPKLCPMDKDSGENIPPIVHKSILVLSGNITMVKKWADKHDNDLKGANTKHQDLERRFSKTDASLTGAWARLDELSAEMKASAQQRQDELQGVAACLDQVLRATKLLIGRVGAAFGEDRAAVEAGTPPAVAAAGGVAEQEEASDPADGRGRRAEADAEPTQVAEADGSEQMLSLTGLLESGRELFTGLESMQQGIDAWGRRRVEENEQVRALQGSTSELQSMASRTRERLLMWRDMLKESARMIDCLGTSIAETQAAVQELQAVQVLQSDVEEAVNRRAKQLEELHDGTERRMDELRNTMDARTGDLQRLVSEAEQLTGERIAEHSQQVAHMVERNLNPINAYLNTMHVKADTVRVELDTLNRWAPTVDARIDAVSSALEGSTAEHRESSRRCEEGLERVGDDVEGLAERLRQEHGELSAALASAEERLSGEVGAVRASLGETANEIDALRRGDVSAATAELRSLEQKVAKWIHAHPLPAKISEARLFALEARLAEESDARLTLEHHVGARRPPQGLTPRGGGSDGGGMLPQLPAQPWGGEAAGRSAMYDAYRLQTSKLPKA